MGKSEIRYKISNNFMLRQVCGEYVIIPVGDAAAINNAMMSPNDSAVSIWKAFQTPHTEDEVVSMMLQEYEGNEEDIRTGVHSFILDTLKAMILEEV